jgi:hypothetical protein
LTAPLEAVIVEKVVCDRILFPEEEAPVSSPASSVFGDLPTKAGVLRATIVPGTGRNQIQSVSFSGIKAEPPGILTKLEQTLGGSTIDEAPGKIEDFFGQNPKALPGVEPEEFLTVLTLAFMKVRRTTSTAPDPSAWKQQKK